MAKYANYREASRAEWTTADGNLPDRQQIAVGCFQRIADATEVTARSVTALIEGNQHLKSENTVLQRQLRAAKGQITKLRKQLAEKGA